MNLDLKQLYKTLSWHNSQRDFSTGEKVGLFITVPEHISKQFPKKDEEDSSPPHITLLYIGNLPSNFEDKLKEVVETTCSNFKRFTVKLGSPKRFINDDNQKVYHSPIKSKKLCILHDLLKNTFQQAQLPFSNKYPKFKPHITISYVNSGEKYEYQDICPQGEWIVDSVWIWGTSQAHLFFLK